MSIIYTVDTIVNIAGPIGCVVCAVKAHKRHETLKKGHTSRTSLLTTPVANEFYAWCKKQFENGKADELPRDIVTLRKMFYKEKENNVD